MGVDLIVTYIPRFERSDERRDALIRMLDGFSDELLLTSYENAGNWAEDTTREEIVEEILDAFDATGEERRDITWIEIPGADYPVDITGGLSHGDTPTEAMEPMSLLSELSFTVWNAMEEWAKQDLRKHGVGS